MQLIAEAYDLLRAGLGAPPGRDRGHLPHLERGRPGLVPDRDHGRGARAHRRRDRPAVRGRGARPGRAEGHRPVDRAERAGPRRPDHRHRRGHVRPGRCPVTRTSATAAREAFGTAVSPAGQRPGRIRGGRPPGAVRVQGGRLRPGLRPDRRGQRGVRLGHRPGRDGDDLARRLHHPGPVPGPDPGGLRRATAELPSLLVAPYFAAAVRDGVDSWRRVVAQAATAGHPVPGVLLVAGLLRRPAPGPAARRADPGPAGQLRRAHLSPGGQAGHVPHRVGGRPREHPA